MIQYALDVTAIDWKERRQAVLDFRMLTGDSTESARLLVGRCRPCRGYTTVIHRLLAAVS